MECEIAKNIRIKRPMAFFAFVIFAFTLVCFFHRNLSFIILITVLSLFVPIIFFRKAELIFPLVLCVFVMLNMLQINARNDRIALICKSPVTEDFVAVEDSVLYDGYSAVNLKCVSGDVLPENTNIRVLCYDGAMFYSGDVYTLKVKVSPPVNDYKESDYGNGVYFSGYIKEIKEQKDGDFFYSILGKIRRYIIASDFSFLKGDSAGILIAITLGNKSFLSRELHSAVNKCGVSHMMAVSGLHLSIVLGNFFKLLNEKLSNKYLKFCASVLTVLFFIAVCGFTKSIIRAGLMFIIAAAAPLFRRDSDSLNSLGTAVISVLLVSPFACVSVAFQLSVLATFAIIYISPFFCGKFSCLLQIENKHIIKIFEIIFDTVFATVATMPVIIRVFGEVSAVSVFANLFLNLFVTAALMINVLALVTPEFILTLRLVFFKIAGACAFIMGKMILGFSELPFASVKMGDKALVFSWVLLIVTVLSVDIFKAADKIKRRKKA